MNSAGCVGLMQMCVGGRGGDSWGATKYAYRRGRRPAAYSFMTERHPDVLDSFDNVMAAAVHLRGKVGGQPDPRPRRRSPTARCAATTAPAPTASPATTPPTCSRAPAPGSATPPRANPGVPALGQTAPLVWPVRGPVTSPFCERRAWEACHPGIDIGVATGTPILAAAAGRVSVVQSSASSGGYGNFTCLQHTSALSHLLRAPAALPRPRRPDRRARPADRDLRLHRPLLRRAPALRGPPRRPRRLPRPLPRPARRARCAPRERPAHDPRAPHSWSRSLALLVAGSGCQDPYGSQPPLSSPSPTRNREATPGDTSRPGPRIPSLAPATAGGSRSPRRRGAVVRRALGQLGLAHGRRAAALARPPGNRPPRPATARQRRQRAHRRQPRARQARLARQPSPRSTSRPPATARPESSSRASRPTPAGAPTSAAGATAST